MANPNNWENTDGHLSINPIIDTLELEHHRFPDQWTQDYSPVMNPIQDIQHDMYQLPASAYPDAYLDGFLDENAEQTYMPFPVDSSGSTVFNGLYDPQSDLCASPESLMMGPAGFDPGMMDLSPFPAGSSWESSPDMMHPELPPPSCRSDPNMMLPPAAIANQLNLEPTPENNQSVRFINHSRDLLEAVSFNFIKRAGLREPAVFRRGFSTAHEATDLTSEEKGAAATRKNKKRRRRRMVRRRGQSAPKKGTLSPEKKKKNKNGTTSPKVKNPPPEKGTFFLEEFEVPSGEGGLIRSIRYARFATDPPSPPPQTAVTDQLELGN